MAAARLMLLAMAIACLACGASAQTAVFSKVTANPDKHAIISCNDARDTQRFTAYMTGDATNGPPAGTVSFSLVNGQTAPSLLGAVTGALQASQGVGNTGPIQLGAAPLTPTGADTAKASLYFPQYTRNAPGPYSVVVNYAPAAGSPYPAAKFATPSANPWTFFMDGLCINNNQPLPEN